MEHRTLREVVIAGIIGATAVALWFLIVDMANGRLFYTPNMLGGAVISVLGSAEGTATNVIAYTLLHYFAFMVIGVIAVAVLHASDRQPAMLIGLLILFVAFQLGFYGFTALMAEATDFGNIAWYQIGLANLVAALAMGWYLFRGHPAVMGRLRHVLAGGE